MLRYCPVVGTFFQHVDLYPYFNWPKLLKSFFTVFKLVENGEPIMQDVAQN